MLTGQIMTRPMHAKDWKDPDGRKLVIVLGVIAVHPDSPLNVKGRQFFVSESPMSLSSDEIVELTVHKEGIADRAAEFKGKGLDYLITSPIWKA